MKAARYGVILADPPWAYTQYRDTAQGAAAASYTTQSPEAIRAIPVQSWAADDCVLAMWATFPKLDEAIDLMRAWGFAHKTGIVWLKNSPNSSDMSTGVGIWHQACAELVLYGVRGTIGGFEKRRGTLQCVVGDRHNPGFWRRASERVAGSGRDLFIDDHTLIAPKPTRHSRKPETLQDYLETFEGPHLELFARRARLGWDCWGYDLGFELGPFGVRERPDIGRTLFSGGAS